LRNWSAEYFRFIETGIPPTNNLAKQTIRRVVLNRRITQGTRNDWGNRFWERFWSISKTCLQQGKKHHEITKKLHRNSLLQSAKE
jgi:hypothetical protein